MLSLPRSTQTLSRLHWNLPFRKLGTGQLNAYFASVALSHGQFCANRPLQSQQTGVFSLHMHEVNYRPG